MTVDRTPGLVHQPADMALNQQIFVLRHPEITRAAGAVITLSQHRYLGYTIIYLRGRSEIMAGGWETNRSLIYMIYYIFRFCFLSPFFFRPTYIFYYDIFETTDAPVRLLRVKKYNIRTSREKTIFHKIFDIIYRMGSVIFHIHDNTMFYIYN